MRAAAAESGAPVSGIPAELQGRTVDEVMVRHPRLLDPAATVADLRAFFDDDHLHAALVTDDTGRLLTVVERADLDLRPESLPPNLPASEVGGLDGRTVTPAADLGKAWSRMRADGRRRLAVVDPHTARLLGLLCLKASGLGFCSDADVEARGRDREQA